MALTQIGQDLAGGNGHRGEQIYRAEALVIVGHRPRPAQRLTTVFSVRTHGDGPMRFTPGRESDGQ
jgi:hypothetical protein